MNINSLYFIYLFIKIGNNIGNESLLNEINKKISENKSKCISIINNKSIDFEEIKKKQIELKVN